MEQIEAAPFEDWTPNEFVPFSPKHGSVQPVPFEDWTPHRFVPFSSVQPGSGSSLQFPYSNTFQQAENLHSAVIGQFRSRRSDNEMESIESAINMEVQDLLTRCLLRGITGNTCASCNVHDNGGSLEGNARNENGVSSSELESDSSKSSSSVDIDFYTPCLKNGTDALTDSQQDSHCSLDSPCNNVNSSLKSSVLEDLLADDNTDNINNACFFKKRKENHDDDDGSSAQSSVNACKPCSKAPSKCDDNVNKGGQSEGHSADNKSVCSQYSCKQHLAVNACKPCSKAPSKSDDNMNKRGQSDLSEGHSADNKSVCSQYSCKQHLAASAQSSDTEVKQQSAKSSKSPFHRRRKKEKEEKKEENKKTNKKTDKKKESNSKLAVATRAENWQVINISERCSLFEYKQEILHQQVPVHRSNFLRQVSSLNCCIETCIETPTLKIEARVKLLICCIFSGLIFM